MFLGGIYGGLLEAKFANINFRESNEATLFETRLVAQKKLQEQTTLGFGKGAFRWGRRCGIFCWSFAYVVFILQSQNEGLIDTILSTVLSAPLCLSIATKIL